MATGEWGTITFEVPDFLEPIRRTINDVMQFLVAVLDIALQVLQFIKAFLIGFLDPIIALVQAILDEVDALMRDLRQLGIYITGDWNLLNFPFDDIRGGFSEYERRMIARLTDRTDPTRPNVSGRTKVLSLFFYLSVDISDVQRLIAFIMKLIAFFKQSFQAPSTQPVPSITSIAYGASAADIMHPTTITDWFKASSQPPQIVEVKWTVGSPAGKNPFNPFPPLPPGGFLISVSTIPEGIPVVYDRPQSATNLKPSVGDPSKKVQPRNYGFVRTDSGQALTLFGGFDTIFGPTADESYNGSMDADAVKPNRTRIYGMQSIAQGTVIPLEAMYSGGKYFFQRTFKVPLTMVGSQWMTGEFSYILKLEDMPHDGAIEIDSAGRMQIKDPTGRPAATVYVRVAACKKNIGDETDEYKFDFTDSGFVGMTQATGLPFPQVPMSSKVVTSTDVGAWSGPQRIVFPNAYTAEYLKAIKTALVVLILSRPDLIFIDQLKGTLSPNVYSLAVQNKMLLPGVVLQVCGLEGFRNLVGFVFEDYKKEMNARSGVPSTFRTDLFDGVEKIVSNLYGQVGPMPDVEKAIVDQTSYLRTATWRQILNDAGYTDVVRNITALSAGTSLASMLDSTIMDSFDPDKAGSNFMCGVGANPYCIGVPETKVGDFFQISGLIQGRLPQMQQVESVPKDPTFNVAMVVPKADASKYLKTNAPGLRIFYEQAVQPDGSLLIEAKSQDLLRAIDDIHQTEGSADNSPVFFVNRSGLSSVQIGNPSSYKYTNLVYCRGIFAKAQSGQLFREASIALSVAASAMKRSPQDGAWIAIRFFDMLPGIDDFLATIRNWLEAIRAALQSIIDTIRKYIEFVEARIVELQQLIRRINALIMSLLSFSFAIPACSALMLMSDGTGGVVADLVSAKNKPNDSPLSYGAGIAVVIPFGPALVMDIIQLIFVMGGGNPDANAYLSSPPPPFGDAIGLGALGPPAPPPGDSSPPDVL